MQKHVHLVDLVKCFQTITINLILVFSIYLETMASMQPRTSPCEIESRFQDGKIDRLLHITIYFMNSGCKNGCNNTRVLVMGKFQRVFTCKIWRRHSRERALALRGTSCEVVSCEVRVESAEKMCGRS